MIDDTSRLMHESRQKLMESVRGLRKTLDLSQTDFGIRLGKSLPTIQRWENTRPPAGTALAQLERLAADNGLEDLAAEFRAALASELGDWDTSEFQSIGIEPRTEIEKLWVAAVLAVLRNPQYADERAKLIRLLRSPAEACVKKLDQRQFSSRITAAIDRLLDLGVAPSAIAKDLDLPEQNIRNRQMIRNMVKRINKSGNWAKGREESK